MTTTMYQGLQSCLEPQLTDSVVLTTKLSSKPKPEAKPNNGWGFFNVLENPTSNDHAKHEEVYVHPMVKRSASALSTKSLEMCTESLGTETGSDVSESNDEFSLEEREKLASLYRSKPRGFDRKTMSHRRGGGGGFPPPLTSISGSDGTVKVRPHRENGRLVIKAVSVCVSNCGIKFEAQRTNGKLSLTLLRDRCVNVESGRGKMKNKGGEEMLCDGDVKGGSECRETDVDRRKVGSKTKVRSSKPKPQASNSSKKSNEFELTKCKGVGNGNNGIGNWSLFRVVIP